MHDGGRPQGPVYANITAKPSAHAHTCVGTNRQRPCQRLPLTLPKTLNTAGLPSVRVGATRAVARGCVPAHCAYRLHTQNVSVHCVHMYHRMYCVDNFPSVLGYRYIISVPFQLFTLMSTFLVRWCLHDPFMLTSVALHLLNSTSKTEPHLLYIKTVHHQASMFFLGFMALVDITRDPFGTDVDSFFPVCGLH